MLTNSAPRNTPATPSTANRRLASGERAAAASADAKWAVPSVMIARPGKNFIVAGLGVGSVWMNMASPYLTIRCFEDKAKPPSVKAWYQLLPVFGA